jgi:hypothetical protein
VREREKGKYRIFLPYEANENESNGWEEEEVKRRVSEREKEQQFSTEKRKIKSVHFPHFL